jgi:NAD(P)-dependent dehydrogenase (short-subunit alcohol dehydrogenase family)
MACRNPEKGERARQQIMQEKPAHKPEVWQLDLASLKSVKSFADKFGKSHKHLDILINNAGIMAVPYARTEDGFEMQFGVNHLGHFALTALLWEAISLSPHSRIVNVSSAAYRVGRIRFSDIHWEEKYSKWGAYGMSKLSNLLFTRELARRLDQAGLNVMATAAHPGYADTDLQTRGALMRGSRLGVSSFKLANRLVAQSAEKGALPTLYAATAEKVRQGAFYGPDGCMGLLGYPAPETPHPKRVNDEVAGKLWDLSIRLTGCEIPL